MIENKLYGVGVGPGDPELLTLKAVRIITECDIIAIPSVSRDNCVAYEIALRAVPSLVDKELLCIDFPMTKDAKKLDEAHKIGADKICSYLGAGKSVAFLTLGDPTVYSTYIYIHRLVSLSYNTEIISGITSFCAASALINDGLVEKSQPLHIIPGSYDISNITSLSGTKVLMKSGRQMANVREFLKDSGHKITMVENCGMPEEKVYTCAEDIPDNSSYYSIIIAKEGD